MAHYKITRNGKSQNLFQEKEIQKKILVERKEIEKVDENKEKMKTKTVTKMKQKRWRRGDGEQEEECDG